MVRTWSDVGIPPAIGKASCLPLVVLSFAVLLSPLDAAKSKASFAKRSDPGYRSALATANRFLQAWQSQDHETGLLMLTDGAKHHSSEDDLRSFFSSGPDAAYEIARGKKLKAGATPSPSPCSHSISTG